MSNVKKVGKESVQTRVRYQMDGKLLCPFHDEYTPSLTFRIKDQSTSRGSFRCLGCGASGKVSLEGNVFVFIRSEDRQNTDIADEG